MINDKKKELLCRQISFEKQVGCEMSNDHNAHKERKALDALQDHLRHVVNSITQLRGLIESWIEGNTKKIEIHLEKLENIEDQANKIKWKILDELSEAETMLHREDFMRLVMTIDEIVDYAEGTGHRVAFLEAWKPDSKSISFITEIMDALTEMITILRESLFVLTQSTEKSVKIARNIYDIERKIDNLHRNMIKHVYSLDIDSKTLFLASNFIEHLEDMADIMETVTDAIRIIAVARKGFF
jgi:predicted phosphate transport protein (TIGR00153 family)